MPSLTLIDNDFHLTQSASYGTQLLWTAERADGSLARHVTDRVRGWVRYVLDLDDEVAVLVTQLACRDAGCSPVETVLAVLHPDAPQSRTLAGPAAELCASDVVVQDRPPSAILPASSSGAPFMTTRSTSGKQDLEGRRRRTGRSGSDIDVGVRPRQPRHPTAVCECEHRPGVAQCRDDVAGQGVRHGDGHDPQADTARTVFRRSGRTIRGCDHSGDVHERRDADSRAVPRAAD